MRVEPGAETDVADMPRLEGSNADGFVAAQRTTTGLWMFEESWLEQGKGTVNGFYRQGWAFDFPRMSHVCTARSWLFLLFSLPASRSGIFSPSSLEPRRDIYVLCPCATAVLLSPLNWAESWPLCRSWCM